VGPKQSQSREETEIQGREERPAAFLKKHKEGHKTKLSRKGIALMQKSKAISFRPGGLSTFDWRVDKRLAHKRKRKMKSKIRKRTKDSIYWCRCFFLRTLGSTWSGMSPSRRPPTLVSGDQSV